MSTSSITRWLRPLVRFRLRTLLIVMLLVCLACGHLGKHVYRKSIERPIVARIEAAEGAVWYDYQRLASPIAYDRTSLAYDTSIPSPGHHLVRRLLGEDIFASVETILLLGLSPNAKDDLTLACGLPGLKGIALAGSPFTDECIAALANVPSIETIELDSTAITPAGIIALVRLPRLQLVALHHSSATDEHIQAAADLPHLRSIQITFSDLTEAGIVCLSGATQLTSLELLSCRSLDDDMLLGLRNLSSLTHLRLSNTAATGKVLESIGNLGKLKVLSSRPCRIVPTLFFAGFSCW